MARPRKQDAADLQHRHVGSIYARRACGARPPRRTDRPPSVGLLPHGVALRRTPRPCRASAIRRRSTRSWWSLCGKGRTSTRCRATAMSTMKRRPQAPRGDGGAAPRRHRKGDGAMIPHIAVGKGITGTVRYVMGQGNDHDDRRAPDAGRGRGEPRRDFRRAEFRV